MSVLQPLQIGEAAFIGPYLVTIQNLRGPPHEALIRYYDTCKWDTWVPVEHLQTVPAKRGRDRRDSNSEDSVPPPVAATQVADLRPPPTVGDEVEIFSARAGWRLAVVGQQTEWGTLVAIVAESSDGESQRMVQLPLDFTLGDVRWPRPLGSSAGQRAAAELEGRKLLVPCRVFGAELEDYLDRYAGVVKQAQAGRRGVLVHFPTDATTSRFPAARVREWLVASDDRDGMAEWEESAGKAELLPSGWPSDVLFCSFPLHRGIEQSLLKRYCTGAQRMRGVEIRFVGPKHPCARPCGAGHGGGTSIDGASHTYFNRGLFAAAGFKAGDALGEYAGCIQSPDLSSKGQHGQFAIELDTSKGFGCPVPLELDAKYVGNEARFINDYRGVASHPNVAFTTRAVPGRGVWVQVSVIAAIHPGDEILVDYGADFQAFDAREPSAGGEASGGASCGDGCGGANAAIRPRAAPSQAATSSACHESEEARPSAASWSHALDVPWSPQGYPRGSPHGSPPAVEKQTRIELYVEHGLWRTYEVIRVNRRNETPVSFSIPGQRPVRVSGYGVTWRLARAVPRPLRASETSALLAAAGAVADAARQDGFASGGTRHARMDAQLNAGPPSKRTRGALPRLMHAATPGK